MSPENVLRFVTAREVSAEESPWGMRESLCRPGFTAAERLYMVRMNMPPGQAHPFHRHPEREEIIYVLSGTAEQWVDRESRILGPGEMTHVPRDVVHGTYNVGSETLVFLAILSPATSDGPVTVDVSMDPPWVSLKQGAPTSSGA